MNKLFLSIIYLIIFSLNTTGQSNAFNDILEAEPKNFSPIITNGEVKGYTMFYELDRVDRKNKSYRISFIDVNLNEINSVDFIESKKTYHVSSTFNGNYIIVNFYDDKNHKTILRKFNLKGEEISKKMIQVEFNHPSTIRPIMNRGYVCYYTTLDSRNSYKMQYFPDDESKGCLIAPPSRDNKTIRANFLCQEKNILINRITKINDLPITEIDFHIQAIDINNGSELFNISSETDQYRVVPSKAYIDTSTGNLELYGMYFEKEDVSLESNSLGFATLTINRKGEIIAESYNSWAEDVSKFIEVGRKNKVEGGFYVYIHNIFKDQNGNVFAIGEQYRKGVSGLGIAVKTLGGSSSVAKLVIEDFMIFKLDSDFKLTDVKIIDKAKENVQLPEGGAMIKTSLLGNYLKASGSFDYLFSQKKSSTGEVNVVYTDNHKREKTLGVISFENGEVSNTKSSSDYDKDLFIKNAKPGSILIYEYDKRKKTVEVRIENLNN